MLRRKTPLRSKGTGLRRVPFKKKPVALLPTKGGEKPSEGRKTAKKRNESSKGELIERLDRVFSLYIRLRDAMDGGRIRCISCGRTFPFAVMQCGHYVHRSVMSVRFDVRNCSAQCPECNCHKSGNLEAYKENLIRKIGLDEFEDMLSLSRTDRKWSLSELKEAITLYSVECRRLSREKGVSICL